MELGASKLICYANPQRVIYYGNMKMNTLVHQGEVGPRGEQTSGLKHF